MRRWVAALVSVVVAAGCAAPPPSPRPDALEVFGLYRGADADRFAEVLDAFEDQTGIEVVYRGTSSFTDTLLRRVGEADAPDVALIAQPGLVAQLARDGVAEPLADEVRDRLRTAYGDDPAPLTAVDGTDVAVWFRAGVKSLVWYHVPTLEELDEEVPTTWAELLALTDRLRSGGLVPWCLGINAFTATGWLASDWHEDLILRFGGTGLYDDLEAGRAGFTDDAVVNALDAFGTVALRPGNVVGGQRSILTTFVEDAHDPMLAPDPGCVLHRRGTALLTELPDGVEIGPDGDIDAFVLPPVTPGDVPPLLASGELAVALTDDPRAQRLLAFLATPEAAEPWARRGGFLSPLPTFDDSLYRTELERELARRWRDEPERVRFDLSDSLPPAVGTTVVWRAMVDYVSGARTAADALAVIDEALAALDG